MAQPCASEGSPGGLDAPTIIGIIRRLELSGRSSVAMVRDRRVVHVFLTSEGHASRHVLSDVMKAYIARLQQNVIAQEQEVLQQILQRLIRNSCRWYGHLFHCTHNQLSPKPVEACRDHQ